MPNPGPAHPHAELQRRASRALEQEHLEEALALYRELEACMPDDASWPERQALVFRKLGRPANELACLQKALDLQVDAGDVLAAIATCKLILDIDPDHPATVECLHHLYTSPQAELPGSLSPLAPGAAPLGLPDRRGGRGDAILLANDPVTDDAPLVELELRGAIAGARPVELADAEPGGVAEIPIESDRAGDGDEIVLELCVEAPLPAASGLLADIPLFGSLEPGELQSLMSKVRVVHVAEGEAVFREGDAADALFVVVEGAVVPIAEGGEGRGRQRLGVIERGDFFGEIGLVTNQPRNATVEALIDSRLIALDRPLMWSLIRGRPEMAKVMLRFLRQRLIDRHIRTNPFFAPFARAERHDVARLFRFLEIESGTQLVHEGVTPDGLFVLLAGRMDRLHGPRAKPLGEYLPGAVFGGLSLFDSGPAGASVVASGKCWVLSLGEARFRKLLASNETLEALFGRLAAALGPGAIQG